ncbi:MAG: undecaprenyl-phosphate galactose phosphotransferase WbaP [Bdellovibrionaceae bacterium]|nr:undecaprenyl-phosphate galactose phosphotransferase WbaP [Pseudobdellovibrionaceae bacterium]
MFTRTRTAKIALLAADLVAFTLAFGVGLVALILYADYPTNQDFEQWWWGTGRIHSFVHFVFVAITLVRFYTKGLYSRRIPFWDELRSLLLTLVYLALLNGMVVLIAKWPFSRVLWLTSWLVACALIPIFRAFARTFLRRAGYWARETFIVGTGETALSAYLAITSEPQLGYQVREFIKLENTQNGAALPPSIPVQKLSHAAVLERLRGLKDIEIIVALEDRDLNEAKQLIEEMSLEFDEIHFVPSVQGLPLFGMEANHFFSHEVLMLRSRNNLHFRPRVWLKRAFDFSAAIAITILASPILLWIAFRIRQSGPGVLFAHTRIGCDGKPFPCFKFRSMVPNAQAVLAELLAADPRAKAEWDASFKLTNDPRITPIGAWLRKTSLDELPQLWNVIRGDMSLVGPRPIVKKEMERYGHRIDFYTSVRPGMTGLWQVSGRSDTDYRTRVHLDTWYVKNWTLWYDIAILFKTIRVVLGRKGAY